MSDLYAKQRIVKEIAKDDERIQVTGYIKTRIDKENFMLDDKTGEVKVKLIKFDIFNFKENDLINVIGDLEFHSNGEKIINAEIVQDMSKLNFEYYQKLYDLKKEFDK